MKVRPARFALLVAASAALASAAFFALALEAPAPTTRGSFEGTWFRVEPGVKQVVQLRRAAGGKTWEFRFYWNTTEGFSFDTNWQPRTEVSFRGFGAVFETELLQDRSTDNELKLRFVRRQEAPRKSILREKGEARLYRMGDGRSLVWFQPLVQETVIGEPIGAYEEGPQRSTGERLWIFSKASRRLLQWDEMPW